VIISHTASQQALKLHAVGVTQIGLWAPELQGETALQRLLQARSVLAQALE